jgi:hypothetical protein
MMTIADHVQNLIDFYEAAIKNSVSSEQLDNAKKAVEKLKAYLTLNSIYDKIIILQKFYTDLIPLVPSNPNTNNVMNQGKQAINNLSGSLNNYRGDIGSTSAEMQNALCGPRLLFPRIQ